MMPVKTRLARLLAVGAAGLASILVAAGCASLPSLGHGARYVAMGSSFAAGPGITTPVEPNNRCSRSNDNYARQLARKRGLNLVDVSCGGATTAHIIGPWNELPAQVEALTPDTALVTVTIGGNDVGYIGGLVVASCGSPAAATLPMCKAVARFAANSPAGSSPALPSPTEENWRKLEAGLDRIASEVRRRSPRARLVFVDYLTVLPEGELCANAPLPPEDAVRARSTASRLADLTAATARRANAILVRASDLSRRHDACSSEPWMTGFTPDGSTRFSPYHPNLAGMTAVANAIDRQLGR